MKHTCSIESMTCETASASHSERLLIGSPPAPQKQSHAVVGSLKFFTSSCDSLLQDIGSCGYGYTPRSSFPYGYVTGPVTSGKLDLYTGKCGSCVEIKCTGTPLVRSLSLSTSRRQLILSIGSLFIRHRSRACDFVEASSTFTRGNVNAARAWRARRARRACAPNGLLGPGYN